MISAPSINDHPTILADWLELEAFSSDDQSANIFLLRDLKDLTQDAEAEDIGDFDADTDAIISRVTDELQQRARVLDSAYPFRVNEAGTILTLEGVGNVGATAYMFCLLMSHVSNSPLLEKLDLNTEARSGRDLFQICATLSAAGWCGGPSISFGWPRSDRSSFVEKLRRVYTEFGDGTPRSEPMPGAPTHIKDGGIDVIAWRRPNDALPGTLYLLGQVASGQNWRDKTVVKDIDLFHWVWFEVPPSSMAQAAMFVPFCFTDTNDEADESVEQEEIIGRMKIITKRFGVFIYRYRLPRFALKAPILAASGVSPIEGLDQFHRVNEWISAFRNRLTGATA